MNKNDLVAAVASNSGLSKADAAKAVDGVFNSVTGALRRGDDVRLIGFGTFSVVDRKASVGRNPRTGERIQIPAPPKIAPRLQNRTNRILCITRC